MIRQTWQLFISPAAQPVVTQRRKVVIEEIVDGKVVSRHEDMES